MHECRGAVADGGGDEPFVVERDQLSLRRKAIGERSQKREVGKCAVKRFIRDERLSVSIGLHGIGFFLFKSENKGLPFKNRN